MLEFIDLVNSIVPPLFTNGDVSDHDPTRTFMERVCILPVSTSAGPEAKTGDQAASPGLGPLTHSALGVPSNLVPDSQCASDCRQTRAFRLLAMYSTSDFFFSFSNGAGACASMSSDNESHVSRQRKVRLTTHARQHAHKLMPGVL